MTKVGGRLPVLTNITTVISGSSFSRTKSGLPNSVKSGEIRGKDAFGNEKL